MSNVYCWHSGWRAELIARRTSTGMTVVNGRASLPYLPYAARELDLLQDLLTVI